MSCARGGAGLAAERSEEERSGAKPRGRGPGGATKIYLPIFANKKR